MTTSCFSLGDSGPGVGWEALTNTRSPYRDGWMIKVCSIWLVWFDYVIILCLYSIHWTVGLGRMRPMRVSDQYCSHTPEIGGTGCQAHSKNGKWFGSLAPPSTAAQPLAACQWQHARSKRPTDAQAICLLLPARAKSQAPRSISIHLLSVRTCPSCYGYLSDVNGSDVMAERSGSPKMWGKIGQQCNYVYDATLDNNINRLAGTYVSHQN